MRAVTVHPDGSYEVDDLPTLEDLAWHQERVGGYIEHVTITNQTGVFCNEDGRMMSLAPNSLASSVCAMLGRSIPLVGSVVFVGNADEEGHTMECPDEVLETIGSLKGRYG